MTQSGILTLLGTGASAGIPVIGCGCAVCTSSLAHNKRTRCSALLRIGTLSLVIDVSPDFRSQCLANQVGHVDGVIITHSHYDHIGGLDDLRIFNFRQARSLPCLMSQATNDALMTRLPYMFEAPDRSKQTLAAYSSSLDTIILPGERGFAHFQGLPFSYFSYKQGAMPVTGFRFGNLAYVTDIKTFPETIFEDLEGVESLVLSSLRHTSNPFHLTVEESVAFARKVGAKQTHLIHMCHELDHQATNTSLPADVQLGYDGLEIDFHLPSPLKAMGPE